MLMKCTFLIMLVLQVNWYRGALQSNVLQESSLNTELLTDLEDVGPTLKIVKKRSTTESLNSTTVELVPSPSEPSTITNSSSESTITNSSSESTITNSSSESTVNEKPSDANSTEEPITKPSSEPPTNQPSTATVSTKPSTEVTTAAVPLQNDHAKVEASKTPKVIEEITADNSSVDDSTQKESDVPESSRNGTSHITNVGDKAIETIQEIGKDILGSVGALSRAGFQWFTNLLHTGSELLTSNGQSGAGKVTETTKQT